MNRVEISGGLTKDADAKWVGQSFFCQFTVAVNGTRYDSTVGAQVVKTTFVTCVVWDVMAEKLVDEGGLNKGDMVHVVGELDQYKKEDREQPSTRVTVFSYDVMRRSQKAAQSTGETPWGR